MYLPDLVWFALAALTTRFGLILKALRELGVSGGSMNGTHSPSVAERTGSRAFRLCRGR